MLNCSCICIILYFIILFKSCFEVVHPASILQSKQSLWTILVFVLICKCILNVSFLWLNIVCLYSFLSLFFLGKCIFCIVLNYNYIYIPHVRKANQSNYHYSTIYIKHCLQKQKSNLSLDKLFTIQWNIFAMYCL